MSEPLQVLIVEDNPADVDLVREALPGAGPTSFHVESAPRLSIALAHLDSRAADLVLLDLGLPDSQGLETLRRLRRAAPGVPVIVLTGLDNEALGLAAVREGAQDYLVKSDVTAASIARSARHAVERARGESRERLAREVLELLNRPQGEEDTTHAILGLIQRETALDAVGIRLRDGDDFPYHTTDGFSDSFVESERSLCARDSNGDIMLDDAGHPVLECMCGLVLSGNTDPKFPFFTPGGSFWTNSSTELLASTTETERQGHTRNRCHRDGYESVALIPLRAGGSIVGLLQLNDHRRERFTPAVIQYFEGLGLSVGIALARKESDALLQAGEERFRTLYENTPIGLYRATPAGRVLLANPAFVKMLGFSSADQLMMTNLAADGFAPSYPRSQFMERVERDGTVTGLEAVWARRDGTSLNVRESAHPVRDSDGKVLFYDGTLEDITERQRAQDALAKSESTYRELVENLNDVIFTTDLEGVVTYVSSPARQVTGYAPEDLTGRPFRDIIHPDDLPGLDRRFREILQNRIEPWEFRYRTRDGAVRWARTSSRPIIEDGRPIGIRGLLSDITGQKEAEAGRDRLLQRLVAINHVTLSLGRLTQLPAILRALHDEVRTLLDADGFFISRYAKETGLITALFAVDEGGELDVSTFPAVPLAPEGRGMQSHVVRTGRPLNVPDWIEGERKMQIVHHIAPDGSFTPPPPETEREGCTKSALLVPMMFRGEPIGVLQVQSNRLHAYSDEDTDLLAGLANVAAVSIQNALLIEEAGQAANELRLSLEGTLRAVSRASETRDPYTAGHQHRVTDLAVAMARELGLSDGDCTTLRAAGLTHDIGKLGIPAEILSKPGTLSPIEFDLIREHPQTAHEILVDVPFPGPVAEIVLQHHERLDGSGYPRALKGEQILREARILAVADVVEAMASHRPYRPALGLPAALAEIEQNAGRLYDPTAVAACLLLFRDKSYVLPA